MSASDSPRQTVIVPIHLGAASNFERDIFSFSSYRQKDKLGKGDFLLDATLDEMLKITSMGTDPGQWEDVIATAKSRYDKLKEQHATLEERSKSKALLQALNLRKTWKNYRAVRLFLDAAMTLYVETRSRSEQIRRTINRHALSAVPQGDVQPAGDSVPSDATVVGLAIQLDGSMDEATEKSIIEAANSLADPFADNPFADSLRSVAESLLYEDTLSVAGESVALSDVESVNDAASQGSPSASQDSRSSITINFIRNSIISPNSTLRGATLNQGGAGNSGSRLDK